MHCLMLAVTLTNPVDIASFQTLADKLNHDAEAREIAADALTEACQGLETRPVVSCDQSNLIASGHSAYQPPYWVTRSVQDGSGGSMKPRSMNAATSRSLSLAAPLTPAAQ
jgi:hypothetical protein